MATLDIGSSLLKEDIYDITQPYEENYTPFFHMYAKIHTVEKNIDHTDGISIMDVTIARDYVLNISDHIEVKILVQLGTYVYDIYPHLDNLEVTLQTTKQLNKESKPNQTTERYKAAYILEKNQEIPTTISGTRADLNQQFPVTIVLQLIDRSAEVLRIKTTQGNFDRAVNPTNRDMSIKAFLKSVISAESNKIRIENKSPIDSVHIEEPSNKDKLKSITIPSGTRLIELPDYIQEKSIGVYSGGLGCYIQKFSTDSYNTEKVFFVYSLYNPNKFSSSEYKTLLYSPVTSTYSLGDITYKYKDKILKVIINTITKLDDRKETNLMSTGSGFRIANANSYMKKPIEIKESGPSFKRDQLNTEIVVKARADGLNYAPNRSVTGNQFHLTSEILQKQGIYVNVTCNNLDHDFISPGSACKINYEDQYGKVKERYGVIHKLIVQYASTNTNLVQNISGTPVSLTSQCKMLIFISPD